MNLLGLIAHQVGKNDLAVELISRALIIEPDYAEAHNNLGVALKELERFDEAISSFHKVLAINPDHPEALNNLGLTLQDVGNLNEAFACHRRAIALNPQNDLFWVGLAVILEDYSFTSVDDNLWQVLFQLLDRPTVRPSYITQAILSALRHRLDFSQVLSLTSSGKPATEITYSDVAEKLSAIPLFLRIMGLCPINDLEIERMLTFLRRAMLQETMAEKIEDKSLPFSAALALQSFTNEYIFSETAEEMTMVENLQQQIVVLLETNQDVPPFLIATFGSYRSLNDFSWAQELSERTWTGAMKDVINRQISAPLQERSLHTQITQLTPILNTVSKAVREQYEENPYPRWVKTSLQAKGRAIDAVLQGAPAFLELGDYKSPESPEILIAGCGTGQHALFTASKFSNARMLAVDLSLSSLSYALRKTNSLGFSNIEYAQGDIMELGDCGRMFDLIESVGVLHHLRDPLAGWRILVDLLCPGGIMRIGLYSESARQDIISGSSLIAEKGYVASAKDIRQCRQDIIAMAADGNPKMAKLCNTSDFFSLSQCRDLLFHVQEHCFTLPQIEAALGSLKLKFLGFEMLDKSSLKEFRKSHPKKSALTSLSLWHQFEIKNPDTFRSMYQFWCQKM